MVQFPEHETIIAQCTPQGSGALALVRLSGNNAIEIADSISLLAERKLLKDQNTHTIHYGWIVKNTQRIDQVLFLLMRGPHTFTGHNTVEITCHNNQFIIEEIIALAIAQGARLAYPGEFSKQAVLNNKIDLIQAEAINELIHANTQVALKKSLLQVEGSFSSYMHAMEKTLVKALALCEASFEFLDEENLTFDAEIRALIQATLDKISQLKVSFDQQNHIRDGIRICIIGSVNAGKSSLFNALLAKKRAIVTNIAGTTRDSIEAGMYKDGNYWTLIDTAGLRHTDDIIEQYGIKRSHEEAEKADIILLVFDSSRCLSSDEQKVYKDLAEKHGQKIIYVKSKVDLEEKISLPEYVFAPAAVCHDNQTKISQLESSIKEKIASLFAEIASPFMLNKRQFSLLCSLEMQLKTILTLIKNPLQYEIISYHLRETLASFSELTGKSISEQGMDAVFKEFCVGK